MKDQEIFNRIYNHEVMPPSFVWDNIALQLDKEEKQQVAPVISVSDRPRTNWLKVALAACFVGMVATTVLWLMEKNKTANPPVASIKPNSLSPIASAGASAATSKASSQSAITILADNKVATATTPTQLPSAVSYTTISPSTAKSSDIKLSNVNAGNSSAQNMQNNSLSANTATDIASTPTIDGTVQAPIGYVPKRSIDEVNATDAANVAGPDVSGDQTITSILNKISTTDDKEHLDSIINASPKLKLMIKEWRNKLIKSGLDAKKVNSMDLQELKNELDERKIKY